MKRIFFIIILLFLVSVNGFSWIYPEHRDIMILAIKKLDPERRAALERYWLMIRIGHETRLSAWPADTTLTKGSRILDYASFPAIGGDHSISAYDMKQSILTSDWILKVSDVAYNLKVGLAKARNRNERLNELRKSDLKLLKADPQYVSRAGANNVHFMLARPEVRTLMIPYLRACGKEGCELNAPGAYWWYHSSALQKAAAFAANPDEDKSVDLLFSALADEGFALHFLEDMFASGHVAGTWGNAAQRKGTHDYYDEKGLEVSTWDGERLVLMGDAFMKPENADRTAITIVQSLSQIIDALSGKYHYLFNSAALPAVTPDTFNVCKAMVMPPRDRDSLNEPLFRDIFVSTVMPGLGKGEGELPRFRSELGPFIGLSAGSRVTGVVTGFHPDQNTVGAITGVEMSVRIGLGLEGVLNEAGDGMVFIDAGYRLDGASSTKLSVDPDLLRYGNITSAIPYRNALHLRLRMPFYIIPGDLIVLAPLLYLISPKTMSSVIATAGNGGLIPWQTGMLSSIGRFQFVLGREAGVYLYGTTRQPDHFIIPVTINGAEDQGVISLRSIQMEFPIIEYRPFHMFSSNQTAGLMVQLFGGVDIPYHIRSVTPENMTPPTLRAIPTFGLRVVFDWRYYGGGSKL